MPPEAEHAGDEPDGDGLAEQGGEHEDHGGEEPRGGADLGVPAAVEGRPRGGGERQRRPDRRLQPPVQRGGRVAEVVHAHVRRGRQAQPAHRSGPAAARASLPWVSAWPGGFRGRSWPGHADAIRRSASASHFPAVFSTAPPRASRPANE